MTFEEYKQYRELNNDWEPGWVSLDSAFTKLYPVQKPVLYSTRFETRAAMGGNEFLDGCKIYQSGKGFMHLVTYGMSELYYDEDAFGKEKSGWGYEMTFKLKSSKIERCLWIINMLSNFAKYTNRSGIAFAPNQIIGNNGNPIKWGANQKITAAVITKDTQIGSTQTPHGKVDFLQIVGITQKEFERVRAERHLIPELIKMMKKDNEYLVTDLSRIKSYL